eukprot:247397-Chlamydomonas_euryale.AAC.4
MSSAAPLLPTDMAQCQPPAAPPPSRSLHLPLPRPRHPRATRAPALTNNQTCDSSGSAAPQRRAADVPTSLGKG